LFPQGGQAGNAPHRFEAGVSQKEKSPLIRGGGLWGGEAFSCLLRASRKRGGPMYLTKEGLLTYRGLTNVDRRRPCGFLASFSLVTNEKKEKKSLSRKREILRSALLRKMENPKRPSCEVYRGGVQKRGWNVMVKKPLLTVSPIRLEKTSQKKSTPPQSLLYVRKWLFWGGALIHLSSVLSRGRYVNPPGV